MIFNEKSVPDWYKEVNKFDGRILSISKSELRLICYETQRNSLELWLKKYYGAEEGKIKVEIGFAYDCGQLYLVIYDKLKSSRYLISTRYAIFDKKKIKNLLDYISENSVKVDPVDITKIDHIGRFLFKEEFK